MTNSNNSRLGKNGAPAHPRHKEASDASSRRTKPFSFERDGAADVAHAYAAGYGEAFPGADIAAVETFLEVGFAGLLLNQTVNRFLGGLQYGMTGPRYSTIRMLYFAPEHQLAQNEIASQLKTTPGNVTQLVDGLQGEGLVERIPSPTSRRVTLARLTPSGIDTAKRLVPEMLNLMQSVSAGLTAEEKAKLVELLEKLRAGAKAVAAELIRAPAK